MLVALVAIVYLGQGLWAPGVHSPITDPDDFRAFYCAGRATLERADPYTTEPIRGCEHAAARVFGLDFASRNVVPAPLPPYALAMFALFGALPFQIASTLWFCTLLLALGVSVILTIRSSGASPVAVAIAFTLAGGLVSINEGQLAPLITAALCIAAVGVAQRASPAAATGLGLAMVEPHVAVTALAAACGERALRPVVFATLAVLGVLDVVAGGPARTIEYFSRVLPSHSHSEIAWYAQQFSLTSTAWSFGMAPDAALLLGTLDYVAMAVFGVAVALRLRARYGERAFLVLVPPAFVLLGGNFIHLFQMEMALPLAFVCYGKMKRRRAVLAFALVGLAIPTQFLVLASPLRNAFYTPPQHAMRPALADEPRLLAEVTEADEDAFGPPPDVGRAVLATVPKIPTWLALLALVVTCVLEAFTVSPARTERRTAPHPA